MTPTAPHRLLSRTRRQPHRLRRLPIRLTRRELRRRHAAISDVSPGLAFVLGLIPGVGAIYNGQYAKGLVHVIIIGLIISMLSNGRRARIGTAA